MTALAAVRDKLVAITQLGDVRADEACILAEDAISSLDRYLERQRQSPSRLLSGVSESCITKEEPFGGGAMQMRARLGSVEVRDIYIGDEETMTDATILANARAAVLDTLRVELVRLRVDEASDRDLLDALDAAERGGDDDVGEIRVAAHDRNLRLL